MKSFFRKSIFVFIVVTFVSNFLFIPSSFAKPKALKAVPKKVIVSVDQIPENLVAFVVPLTFDKNIINIADATSNLSGALVVFSQDGVGVIQTKGNLPSMFDFSINFKGLARGKTTILAGEVVDKLGGTPIEGVVAKAKVKKIKVK